ncbi:MAG: hypothetical protein RIS17_807 [Pseudomonadota bacterium]|jgi:DNA-binding transcriptional LysR family regulator
MDADYELFVAIVEEGNLAKAARSLNLSRPVVTKRLQRLEDKLGVSLLHRTTRRVLTTQEGQSFYEEIKPVILAAKIAESNVAALKHPQSDRRLRGEIKIRTVNSIARNLLAPALFSFSRKHPDIRMNVLVLDQPIDLLSIKVDAEITFAPPFWQDVTLETLAMDRRILCASPKYLAEKGAPTNIEELHDHAVVASPISMPWRLKGPDDTSVFFHGKSPCLPTPAKSPAS